MMLHRLFQFSTLLRSVLSVQLRRNIGFTAVVFNKAKTLDPIQKLFVDKIRDYDVKSAKVGGPVDAGAEYQKTMDEEIIKLQRLYGGGDLLKFPDFKFEEPKFDEVTK
uniref:ATP synthase-coupling factor 6, mitochondrial n=1 Tax=Pristiophorus japonicus TaxID=55135 RepID=UPI00398F8321